MGGRVSATNARNVERMNGGQLNAEIRKARERLTAAQKAKAAAGTMTAEERAMREQFPLGSGGFSRGEANKIAGRNAETAIARGKRLEAAMARESDAKKRLEILTKEKASRQRAEKASSSAPASTMTWKTTQKASMANGGLRPRIISSGSYEIRGTSVLRVYYNGNAIGTASTLSAAKAIAEKHKRRK